MRVAEEWTPFSWHCANCGTIVKGYKNAKGDMVWITDCRMQWSTACRTIPCTGSQILHMDF